MQDYTVAASIYCIIETASPDQQAQSAMTMT